MFLQMSKCPLLLILCSLALILSTTTAIAQEVNGQDDPEFIYVNRDDDGKPIRGAYLTNPWYSNWSVNISGGVQTLVSGTKEHNTGMDFGTARPTPSIEIDIAKWFTPVIGVRFGYQGIKLEENFQAFNFNHYPVQHVDGVNYYFLTNLHMDVMWNFVNTIWGYRANRFYNITPYAMFSYVRLGHPDKSYFDNEYRDREFMTGLGIFNTFRLSNAFQVTVDLRWGNLSGRFHDSSDGGRVNFLSATAGIAYNIEKWYWARSKGIEKALDVAVTKAAEAQEEAMAAVAELNEERRINEELKVQIVQLTNTITKTEYVAIPGSDFHKRVDNSDLVLYYQINVSKMNFAEEHHLDAFVSEVLAKDPKHVFYLTGSADMGTGSLEVNTRLSRERAEGVKSMLMSKYNVPEEQIVIKATIVSDVHEDGGLDRCVLIERE